MKEKINGNNFVSLFMIISILTIVLIFSSGCSKSAPKLNSIEFSLQEQGIYVVDIDKGWNGDITFTYETSLANEYDSQLIVDWGSLFATGSSYGYSPVNIINTVNGEEMVKLTAKKKYIDSFINGTITQEEFWQRVDFVKK